MIRDNDFWNKVDKNGPVKRPELGRCWVWLGEKHRQGYGRLQRNGKRILAHRWAWFLVHGKFPTPCGLHKCDNEACVRPSHLFEGTDADNAADKVRKDRQARGEQVARRGEEHAQSVLTDDKVISIRVRVRGGEMQKDVAERFGVSKQVVNDIVRGRSWTHVGGPIKTVSRVDRGRRRMA